MRPLGRPNTLLSRSLAATDLNLTPFSLALSRRLASQIQWAPAATSQKTTFEQFDLNGDGSIDADELRTALEAMGQSPSNEEVTAALSGE